MFKKVFSALLVLNLCIAPSAIAYSDTQQTFSKQDCQELSDDIGNGATGFERKMELSKLELEMCSQSKQEEKPAEAKKIPAPEPAPTNATPASNGMLTTIWNYFPSISPTRLISPLLVLIIGLQYRVNNQKVKRLTGDVNSANSKQAATEKELEVFKRLKIVSAKDKTCVGLECGDQVVVTALKGKKRGTHMYTVSESGNLASPISLDVDDIVTLTSPIPVTPPATTPLSPSSVESRRSDESPDPLTGVLLNFDQENTES